MTADLASALISGGTLVLSLSTTLAIVAYKTGQFRQKLTDMETKLATKADLSDMASIKEALAEIKGMFVLRLRE
jgi:hypothetical protein